MKNIVVKYSPLYKRQRIPKKQSKMDNSEKLTTQGKQDDEWQNKKHNTIFVGHHYTQTNTNNVNKTWQTTGGKDESNIVFMSFISYTQH